MVSRYKSYRLCVCFVAMLFCFGTRAQNTFGNEWIEPTQEYYKFFIEETGVYRIFHSTLVGAGVPVNGSNFVRRVQIFRRGEELAIKVIDQNSNGLFDTEDFIEFYAERNDGQEDSDLYIAPEDQPQQYQSLFHDEAAYFLTVQSVFTSGKRMQTFFESNVSNISPDQFYTEKKVMTFTNEYTVGRRYGFRGGIKLSQFDIGEGWTDSRFRSGQSRTFTFSGLDAKNSSGNTPHLRFLVTGKNGNQKSVTVLVGPDVNALREIDIIGFSGYTSERRELPIVYSDISTSGDLIVRFTMATSSTTMDAAISFLDIDYSRRFNYSELEDDEDQTLRLETHPNGKSYFEANFVRVPTGLLDITDKSSPIDIGYEQEGATLKVVVDNTDIPRELYFYRIETFAGELEKVDIPNPSFASHDFLIVTSERLRPNPGSGPVDDYKAYRESSVGGGFSVQIVTIEDLYNLFSYGDESPIAIRRYCDYMISLDGADPQYLFLIGRGLVLNDSYRRNNPARDAHFVPTYGFPGTDALFTAGLGDSGDFEEAIPTGRINAESEAEITSYLDKVIEIEGAPVTDLRRKQLLHLSGGNSDDEQRRFQGFVDEFQSVAEGTLLGGGISQKAKATTDPVELILINEEINEGIALTTFFGHSSSSAADIDVGFVSNPDDGYDNRGKYGFFLVHGCNAGNFYRDQGESFGDDWINTPGLGIVGFMAHSDQGFDSSLKGYGDAFYAAAFRDEATFGKSIGLIRKSAQRQLTEDVTLSNIRTFSTQVGHAQQMVFLGDPALKLFPTDKSEYEIKAEDVSFSAFEGQQLLSTVDSFLVHLDIRNYGKFGSDSLEIEISRQYENGSQITYPLYKVPSIANERTVDLVIDNADEVDKSGINTFTITLDPNDSIPEDEVASNEAEAEIFFARGSTSNVLPANLSIVGTEEVRLVTHPTDLLNYERVVLMEVDDNDAFTTPLSFSQTSNPVINQTIDLNDIINNIPDTTVIFWRTRLANPGPNESSDWNTSSFTYISNRTGWGQLRSSQYDELTTDGVSFNSSAWGFDQISVNIDVETNGAAIDNFGVVTMKVQGQDIYTELDGGDNPTSATDNCRANTLNFVVFDKRTTTVLRPTLIDGQIREFNEPRKCGKNPQSIYSFNNAELASNDVNITNLFNEIESEGSVLVFSVDSVNYDGIHPDVLGHINNLGLGTNAISNLTLGESVIFLGKKDAASGTAIEIRGNNSNPDITLQEISLNAQVVGNISDGVLTSPLLGPAASWKTVSTNLTTEADDQVVVEVIGIKDDGADSVLFSAANFTDFDLSAVDAEVFPRLRLSAAVSDVVNLSPAGFQWWTVEFDRVPEGILVLREAQNSRTNAVTLTRNEGEVINQGLSFINVSDVPFQDSLSIAHELILTEGNETIRDTLSISPVSANTTLDFDLPISTIGNVGNNDLRIQANVEQQREESFGNNILSVSDYVEVIGDVTNPLLDVSFDGQIIFNNDIVSPNPRIAVVIKDDNTLKPKLDTTGVSISLRQNCETCPDFSRVPFDGNSLSWSSGDTDSDFEAVYLPGPLENGNYTLRVRATDQSGNRVGEEPYEISFEVINESMISNFYPYPNPFSTSTRFVFTLTGSELPEDLKIQIMTISGRVVREVFMEELGNIHIGNNISDFAWNGRDQYGDQLANGVYLYRVMIKNRGDNFKAFETSGDKAFKKGFGKMYLLR